MRIFFDTEFYENGRTIELISIGLVTENGSRYYAEVPNAEYLASETEWLKENVFPSLHCMNAVNVRKPRDRIAREIKEFVGESPEFWAYYADYDWVVLCQLYGG